MGKRTTARCKIDASNGICHSSVHLSNEDWEKLWRRRWHWLSARYVLSIVNIPKDGNDTNKRKSKCVSTSEVLWISFEFKFKNKKMLFRNEFTSFWSRQMVVIVLEFRSFLLLEFFSRFFVHMTCTFAATLDELQIEKSHCRRNEQWSKAKIPLLLLFLTLKIVVVCIVYTINRVKLQNLSYARTIANMCVRARESKKYLRCRGERNNENRKVISWWVFFFSRSFFLFVHSGTFNINNFVAIDYRLWEFRLRWPIDDLVI